MFCLKGWNLLLLRFVILLINKADVIFQNIIACSLLVKIFFVGSAKFAE